MKRYITNEYMVNNQEFCQQGHNCVNENIPLGTDITEQNIHSLVLELMSEMGVDDYVNACVSVAMGCFHRSASAGGRASAELVRVFSELELDIEKPYSLGTIYDAIKAKENPDTLACRFFVAAFSFENQIFHQGSQLLANSFVGSKFTVNQVPVEVDSATRVNIKKRHEQIVYRSISNEDRINCAYLIGEDITPSKNLFISDRSISLVQNRIPSLSKINTKTTGSILLNVDQFLATDQFTTPTPTQPKTPLFFVHTLGNFNIDVENWSNKELLSIGFADSELSPISVTRYIMDSTTGKFYNNLENSYDPDLQKVKAFFIQYTVRTTIDGVVSVNTYSELIDNDPVYTQADFDDLDAYGNLQTDGRKKYLIEEKLDGTQFEITFPVVAEYAYRELPESRLKLIQSTAVDTSVPWNVSLTNGRFITSLRKTATTFQNYKYQIAEFDAQTFTPFPPYKIAIEERAAWLTKNLIKVAKNIVNDSGLALYVEIIIQSATLTPKFAYSTDPLRIGLAYAETDLIYKNGITSIDRVNGFIAISDNLMSDDIITATYYTEEKQYELTEVDFNPLNSLDILNQRIAVYVAPETITSDELDQSIHYVVMDPLGRITFSSQAAGSATSSDAATLKMITEDFLPNGAPRRPFYYDTESTSSGLASRVSGVNASYIQEFSFVDKYTINSQLMSLITTASGSLLENAIDNPRFLVLGELYTGEAMGISQYEEFDVRTPGGGIKPDKIALAIAEESEVNWYWDLNAARPYPSVSSFYVEVPQSVHEDFGGQFTREEVKDVIEKHMGMGGYAITKFYGIEPHLTSAVIDSGCFQIYWPSYGSSVSYQVYLSKVLTGPWTTATASGIDDVSSGNTYLVSGLIPSTKYYVYVESTLSSETSAGPVVALTTSGINAQERKDVG